MSPITARRFLVLALLTPLALASPGVATASMRNFVGAAELGTPPPTPPQPPLPNLLPFDDACGVAESTNGVLYVSDYNHGFVAEYDAASGDFVRKIPSPEVENSPCDLAVDAGATHLYANLLHQGVVDLIAGTTVDPARSTGVALDPSDGNVYVAHRTSVSVYGPGGSPSLGSIGAGGALEDAFGIAVSGFPTTLGYVYVGDAATDTIKVFDPATDPSLPIEEIDGAATPSGGFSDLTDTDLAIDPTNGDLLVVDDLQPRFQHPVAAVDEFAPDGTYLGQISHWSYSEIPPGGGPPIMINRFLVHGGPTGLAFSPDGRLYVTSGNELGSVLYRFATATSATAPLSVSKAGAGSGAVVSGLPGLSSSATFTGIECGLICATEYPQGAATILTAVPAPHSTFAGWSVAGNPAGCPGTGACQLTVTAATEVTATFTETPQRTLAIGKAGSGSGRVASSPPGLDCGLACSADFDQGTQLKLLAEPAAGSRFSGWSGACSGSGARCDLTLNQDAEAVAEFTLADEPARRSSGGSRRTLAVVVGGSGNGTVASDPAGISCGGPCSAVFDPGRTVTLIAASDRSSHFAGWSGCDSAAADRCTVTLDGSKTVGAEFAPGALLALGAVRRDGGRVILTATAAAPGTLAVTNKLLKPVRTKVAKAGAVKARLSLNGAGRKALARARTGRLRLKAKLTFVTSAGLSLELTRTIDFKDRRKR